ncbi:MAG: class I SAM-dependent methyltransferase [Gammaproteobacteria bacterium]|nr:class I SAM-dependent methyltransferase [Gammaproteobacteria bacterium]
MKKPSHITAKASHYNKEADTYDTFNEENSKVINQVIDLCLKKNKVKSVLDLSTGTGSQALYLSRLGYDIVGVDINSKMLSIAKSKLKRSDKNIKFIKGDMRTKKVGKFDAVITIFNAIGHLTRSDFSLSLKNIYANLKPGGIYIFDIFNLNYLLKDNNITRLTIDNQKKMGNKKFREIQYSTIDEAGILASYDIYHEQVAGKPPKITKSYQTLQVYTKEQLVEMLQSNGFIVLKQCGVDGSRFYQFKTERLLMVAKKSRS